MSKLSKFSYVAGIIGGGLAIGTIGNIWLAVPGLSLIGVSMIGFMVDKYCRSPSGDVVFTFESSPASPEATDNDFLQSGNVPCSVNPIEAFEPPPAVTIHIPIPPVQISPPILVGYNAMVGQMMESHMDLEASVESVKRKKAVKTSI